jgi:hypothetical protein
MLQGWAREYARIGQLLCLDERLSTSVGVTQSDNLVPTQVQAHPEFLKESHQQTFD